MGFLKSLTHRLQHAPDSVVALYAALASLGVYFCMYAFRKPFAAAGFDGLQVAGISYKVWLVTAQVLGYMLSKFYGITLISSLGAHRRAGAIRLLVGVAWLALFLFAVTPAPYNSFFLLVNGFPLGMVWGLVFSYLEGRRYTEVMGVVLATSFIFASGVAKSIGSLLLAKGVSVWWMPFAAGTLFLLPMLLFTFLLHAVPPPTAADVALRTARRPMTPVDRRRFLTQFLPGLVVIVTTYVLLTILRDFRDNFANELWAELGYGARPAVFTRTEVPVSLLVLLAMGLLVGMAKNIHAFLINHLVIAVGYAICIGATLLFTSRALGAVPWMMGVGTGLYMAYVPFNALYFERLIATYKINGNVGFVMYIADAFGYLGSALVLFVKEFSGVHLSWTAFFVDLVFTVSALGITGTAIAAFYFRKKYTATQPVQPTAYAI